MAQTDLLTSVCLCTYISSAKRLNDLHKVYQSMEAYLCPPCEVVIVDDRSPLQEATTNLTDGFITSMKRTHPNIPVRRIINEVNNGHSKSQNLSMAMAKGDVLIHIEDDIVVDYIGWNQAFAKCLLDHPEVGQVLPNGSGRGEHIPRPGYKEFAWGLGGLFAIRREVFEKVGGWDEWLVHQIEPDYNFRVRMAGWRLGEIEDFSMGHLGEGDLHETFERQAQITIGVYNFLKKWNRRFIGAWGYGSIWAMSPDDYPINVNFRRQLAAYWAARGASFCQLNATPETFIFPTHYGKFDVIKTIRPCGREREKELIEKMNGNYIFKDEPELHKMIKELADRMFVAGKLPKLMSDEDVSTFLKGKEIEFNWAYTPERLEKSPMPYQPQSIPPVSLAPNDLSCAKRVCIEKKMDGYVRLPITQLSDLPAGTIEEIVLWYALDAKPMNEAKRILEDCRKALIPGKFLLVNATDLNALIHAFANSTLEERVKIQSLFVRTPTGAARCSIWDDGLLSAAARNAGFKMCAIKAGTANEFQMVVACEA